VRRRPLDQNLECIERLSGVGARGNPRSDGRAVGRQEGFDNREGVADGGRGARCHPERSKDFDALPQRQPPPEIRG
jgi:hypothetical protein